jgi:hypothetical protein
MSTYLQLCQALRREASIAGASGTPSAVTDQTGQMRDVVEWVKQAWTVIQNRHTNWRWLRSRFTVNTVADDDTYAYSDCTDSIASAAISRFSHWWALDEAGYSGIKSYLQSAGVAGEMWLSFLPWADFRARYRFGTQTSGTPVHFTVDPQNNLVLGPAPNAVFVVSGEYQKSAQILAANSDTPEMPSQFHDLVWLEAMRRYAGKQAAPEAMSRAIGEGNRLLRQLEVNQLPPMGFARPLA